MIVLEVFSNGKSLCRASIGEAGTLLAAVTWVSARVTGHGAKPEQLRLEVIGIASPQGGQVRWVAQDVALGDRITIQVTESDDADTPAGPKATEGTAA